jgi:hypothetical protein
MNRWWVLPILCGAMVAGAWADDAPDVPSATEQAQLFQRNRDLIQTLVTGGLKLANEEDRVKRVGYCGDLARQLANELRLAAQTRDGFRTAELGEHLSLLLHEGMARNLKLSATPPESPGIQEMRGIRDGLKKELLDPLRKDLTDDLKHSPREVRLQIQQALKTVQDGWEAVDQAVPAGPNRFSPPPVPSNPD